MNLKKKIDNNKFHSRVSNYVYSKNRSKISFLTTALVFSIIIGILFFHTSIGIPNKIRLKVLFISFLPSIIISFFIILKKFLNKKISKERKLLLKIIFTYLLIFYYIFSIVTISFIRFENPITDKKYYSLIAKSSKIFPKEIPNNVEKVEFKQTNGLLQAETSTSLYYVDKNLSQEDFQKKYQSQSIWTGYYKDYNKENHSLTSNFFNQENKDNFLIYLIEDKCYQKSSCNHGNLSFVAINEITKEVIYESKYW